MELTKEEIKAQIDILEMIIKENFDISEINITIILLKNGRELVKSIKDLQKEAFEAGRNKIENKEFDRGLDEPEEMFSYEFNNFEDYLKSKENGR